MNYCKNCNHYRPGKVGGQATGQCLDPSKIIKARDGREMNKPPAVNPMHHCSNYEAANG